MERYLTLLDELGLTLAKVVDTHVHADHISGMAELRDRTKCVTVMGREAPVDVVSMRVGDGDPVEIEGVGLRALHTPGHTAESYSFAMEDRVFTGDTLLIRGTGRTDFQNGDPLQQYASLVDKLADAARRDAGLSRPRLQGRHGEHPSARRSVSTRASRSPPLPSTRRS